MARLVAFGASHSVGLNQSEWDIELRYSRACYPVVMANKLNCELIHKGKVGVGVDYIDRAVLYDEPAQDDDIAVVQLISHYFFKTMYEPKTGRTFGAVTHYTSIDANPFSFKVATIDDLINLLDFMHNVNSIIETIRTRYNRCVFFLCSPVRNFIALANKIEEHGSPLERQILSTFNKNLIHQVCAITFEDFAATVPDGECYQDNTHFNSKVHSLWADYLVGQVK